MTLHYSHVWVFARARHQLSDNQTTLLSTLSSRWTLQSDVKLGKLVVWGLYMITKTWVSTPRSRVCILINFSVNITSHLLLELNILPVKYPCCFSVAAMTGVKIQMIKCFVLSNLCFSRAMLGQKTCTFQPQFHNA